MKAPIEPRGIHRRTVFNVNQALRTRLTRKIATTSDAKNCWEWTGAQRNGYGAIKHEGKVLGTHVVAYVIFNGELPEGCIVTHSCDNRLCCNPEHLFAGTPTTNNREMWDRRPQAAVKGEEHPSAVLTFDSVRLIHAMATVPGISKRGIARMFGIHEDAVRCVLTGQNWRHVPKPNEQEIAELLANVDVSPAIRKRRGNHHHQSPSEQTR